MEATDIIIAVIGGGLLLLTAFVLYAAHFGLEHIQALFDKAISHEKKISEARTQGIINAANVDKLYRNYQKLETRIGQLEDAVFNARLGERLATAEAFTNLVELEHTPNGVVINFIQDEKDPSRKVHEIIVNDYRIV